MIDQRKLKAALAEHDVPQWKLAKRLRIPPTTLSDWVRGARPTPDDLSARIERELSLPVGSLELAA